MPYKIHARSAIIYVDKKFRTVEQNSGDPKKAPIGAQITQERSRTKGIHEASSTEPGTARDGRGEGEMSRSFRKKLG